METTLSTEQFLEYAIEDLEQGNVPRALHDLRGAVETVRVVAIGPETEVPSPEKPATPAKPKKTTAKAKGTGTKSRGKRAGRPVNPNSWAQLYKEAQKLGIKGRTSMDQSELTKAVRKARTKANRAA